MRWILGLDLRPLTRGGYAFARWVSSAGPGSSDTFVGVHVLEEEHLRVVLRYHHLDEVVQSAESAAAAEVEREGASALVREVHVVQGRSADEALDAARSTFHADAVVIGRAGRREGPHFARLGRIARHLLHRTSSPVVVVPPELAPGDIGGGPIVALSTASDASLDSCRFAARMSEHLDRGLALLHVVPLPEEYGAHHLPPATGERLRRDLLDEGQARLTEWATARGLRHATLAVREGAVPEVASAFAAELASPLLVAGSHSRSALDRVFITSVAVELAAAAARPVAVVPSG